MPGWLHGLIYREQPYYYVHAPKRDGQTAILRQRASAGGKGGGENEASGRGWFYRTKQRKLLKMEVDQAFEIRSTVLCIMGLVLAGSTWALWRVGSWTLTILLRR